MRWVFLLLLLVIGTGCAHGGSLFAFPVGSDPPNNPNPAPATTFSDEPAPSVIRSRIRTRASTADVNRTACSLRPTIALDGEGRPVDVFVGGVTPCAAALEGAIRVNLRVMSEDSGREAVLELVVPQGATPNGVEEMKTGLREIEREMARRLATIERAELATDLPPAFVPREEPRRRSGKVLLVSEILWGVTGAIAATGVVMILGGVAHQPFEDSGWVAAGGGTLLFLAAPVAVGALTTLIIAGGMYAGEN